MTHSAVQAFRKELEKNPGLRAKVQAISKQDKAAAVKQLVGIAAAAGFKFTTDEAQSLIQPARARELSQSDLEGVAGGGEQGFGWNWSGGDEDTPN